MQFFNSQNTRVRTIRTLTQSVIGSQHNEEQVLQEVLLLKLRNWIGNNLLMHGDHQRPVRS